MAPIPLGITSATVVISLLGAATGFAQTASPDRVVRVVPGVAYEIGVFGDDVTARHTEVAPTIAIQLWNHWGDSRALVVEGAFQLNALENPWFDEKVRLVFFQVAPEWGRRFYWRPSVGLALRFWSGSEAVVTTDAALAVGLAMGYRIPLGARLEMSPEAFFRLSAASGASTPAYGVQFPIGLRVRGTQ